MSCKGKFDNKSSEYLSLEEATVLLNNVMENFHFDDLTIASEIDLVLPKSSDERVNVSWHSSNEDILSNDGKVYLPTQVDVLVKIEKIKTNKRMEEEQNIFKSDLLKRVW